MIETIAAILALGSWAIQTPVAGAAAVGLTGGAGGVVQVALA